MIEKFFDKVYDYTRYQTLFVAVIVQAIADYYAVNRNEKPISRKIRLQRIKHSLEAKRWFKTEDCKFVCNLANIDYNYLISFLKNSHHQEHFASKLSVDDTRIIPLAEIDEMRVRGKLEELIQQEFYCSFAGAMTGSYYSDILNSITESNIIDINYDGEAMVQTLWDLGVSDSMAIWFVIVRANRIEVLDYYEANGYGLGHYVDVINSKPYKYIKHNLPHDGGHRTLSTAEKASTIQNQLLQLGLNNVAVHERTNDIYGDIQAVRSILNKCYFDKTKCKKGLDCLKNYRREFDEKRNCFKEQPLHDWTSHGADAFRILPKIYNKMFTNSNSNIKQKEGFQCKLFY